MIFLFCHTAFWSCHYPQFSSVFLVLVQRYKAYTHSYKEHFSDTKKLSHSNHTYDSFWQDMKTQSQLQQHTIQSTLYCQTWLTLFPFVLAAITLRHHAHSYFLWKKYSSWKPWILKSSEFFTQFFTSEHHLLFQYNCPEFMGSFQPKQISP